jgi:hypothetical protein
MNVFRLAKFRHLGKPLTTMAVCSALACVAMASQSALAQAKKTIAYIAPYPPENPRSSEGPRFRGRSSTVGERGQRQRRRYVATSSPLRG